MSVYNTEHPPFGTLAHTPQRMASSSSAAEPDIRPADLDNINPWLEQHVDFDAEDEEGEEDRQTLAEEDANTLIGSVSDDPHTSKEINAGTKPLLVNGYLEFPWLGLPWVAPPKAPLTGALSLSKGMPDISKPNVKDWRQVCEAFKGVFRDTSTQKIYDMVGRMEAELVQLCVNHLGIPKRNPKYDRKKYMKDVQSMCMRVCSGMERPLPLLLEGSEVPKAKGKRAAFGIMKGFARVLRAFYGVIVGRKFCVKPDLDADEDLAAFETHRGFTLDHADAEVSDDHNWKNTDILPRIIEIRKDIDALGLLAQLCENSATGIVPEAIPDAEKNFVEEDDIDDRVFNGTTVEELTLTYISAFVSAWIVNQRLEVYNAVYRALCEAAGAQYETIHGRRSLETLRGGSFPFYTFKGQYASFKIWSSMDNTSADATSAEHEAATAASAGESEYHKLATAPGLSAVFFKSTMGDAMTEINSVYSNYTKTLTAYDALKRYAQKHPSREQPKVDLKKLETTFTKEFGAPFLGDSDRSPAAMVRAVEHYSKWFSSAPPSDDDGAASSSSSAPAPGSERKKKKSKDGLADDRKIFLSSMAARLPKIKEWAQDPVAFAEKHNK